MNITLLLTLLTAAAAGLFGLTRQLQMLQQNSYFPSRYFSWVRGSYAVGLCLECMAYCLSSLLFERGLYSAQLIFLLCITDIRIVLNRHYRKVSIKKLAFTARIKRFYATAALIYALLISAYLIAGETLIGKIAATLLLMLSFLTPLSCLFYRFVTAPVDRAINRYYINDAKRILHEHKNLTVIGVTGSYGKTSVKFILNRILSEKYNVVATPHSFNTPLGVVRTIRESIKPQTQIFICEMGAKNVGDIKEICDIVHPKYGIITSVGEQHLETFKTVDNVFKTKFELANEVFKNGGEVFVNGDSPELIKRLDKSGCRIYGTGDFEFCAENIGCGRNGSRFSLKTPDCTIDISTRLLGLHSILNTAGAAALAYTLGVTPADISFAAASLTPTEHRLELKASVAGSLLIDDAYNANPEGSLEAVRLLSYFDGMKKVIITPGLIELGNREHDCNFALGLEAAKICDIIIFVGKRRSEPLKEGALSVGFPQDRLFVASSFKEAMELYTTVADKNTVVLLENDLPDNYLN